MGKENHYSVHEYMWISTKYTDVLSIGLGGKSNCDKWTAESVPKISHCYINCYIITYHHYKYTITVNNC